MAALGRYIVRRAIQGVITLFIVTIIIFLLFKATPGSPLDSLRANPATPRAVLQALADQYGLNDPFQVQMYKFLVNMFTFQFGYSSLTNQPVVSILQQALPRTLFLFGGAVVFEYIIGVLVGRYIAWKRGRFSEGAAILTSLFFYNMPSFWIGLILLFAFAYTVNWFPLTGFESTPQSPWISLHYPQLQGLSGIQTATVIGAIFLIAGIGYAILSWRRESRSGEAFGGVGVALGVVTLGVGSTLNFNMFQFADVALHAFLPMVTLVLISCAGTILLMQTSMLEVMGEDFILTARAKGLSERAVRKRHAARNAYLPIVTNLAISLGFVVGGAIVLEQIFTYYGMGYYLLQAIYSQDRFLAGSILFIISVLVIFGNIVADILYGWLDPRVRI